MSVITLDQATLRIGDRTVLSDVSIDIEAGEFIGVLGPNGAGKTTLMRAVLGLLSPSKGSLKVFGHTPERGNSARAGRMVSRNRLVRAGILAARQNSKRDRASSWRSRP